MWGLDRRPRVRRSTVPPFSRVSSAHASGAPAHLLSGLNKDARLDPEGKPFAPDRPLCRRVIDSRSECGPGPACAGPWILAVVDSSPSDGSDVPNAVSDPHRGTGDWDQPGSAASPREPIGGLPGRRQGRFDAPFYPFQPQQAWLQGSILTVEFNGESAMCDLVTAARIRIRGRPVPVFNHRWGIRRPVRLSGRQKPARPARSGWPGLVPADWSAVPPTGRDHRNPSRCRRPASARDHPDAEQNGQ